MEAAVKPRKSVIKRQKKEATKQAKAQGASEATLKNVSSSPRKMRLVADIIRGENVQMALSALKYQPQAGARKLEKLLLSAIANWQSKNEGQDVEELFIKEIFVDAGRMLKRLRPAPQGRAYRVRKRSNHVTLVLDSRLSHGPVTVSEVSEKEEKPETKKAKTADKKTAESKTSKKTTASAKTKSETGAKKTKK